jgi:hypothetical protein
MSIRLRLTLLYSAIVALTLVAFSIILYLVEAQATLETIQTALVRQADLFGQTNRRAHCRLVAGFCPAAGRKRAMRRARWLRARQTWVIPLSP